MTEKKLSTLVINQVENIDVYNLLKTQGKINQDELYLISGEADAITGVKGNKETTYRTGNVNLTPADIGALPDTTEIPVIPTNISAFYNDAGYLTQHQSLTDYPKKTELANVATSGDYTDLINTPAIPSTEGLATETYVQNKIAEVVNSAPGTLDTLNELAQALGNDPNFATTMATELGKKANTASLATVATSGSYNDLSDTPTIPSVGNGTLTIQKNGTSAGTFTANATTDKTINIIVPTKVSELTDDVISGKYLPLVGGTMTGKLTVPQVETGDGNSNFFQCRKFRGEGDANTYYHAIDFGYANHDKVDFHEYGGIWNFFKNTSGKAGEGSLCGKITTKGWEGDAKLTGSPTAPTPGTSDNSTRIATTAFVNSFNSTKLESNGDGSNVTATFTAASSRTNISTGEKLSVLFGKIAKWLSDLGSLAFKSTVAKTDLASDVQTSLGKADSALQSVTKSDVGLGNVDNVKQYSANNPPPYPVTSVNGKTGAVTIREVPAVTTSDNGKFLRVVNGAWAAVKIANANGVSF